MMLTGKRVLVTGGAVRIGRCICEVLSRRGCTVVVHCRTSLEEGQRLALRLSESGVPAFCVQGSLKTEQDAVKVVSEAVALAGGLDILINNASAFNKDAFMNADEQRLQAELGINAFAPMFLSRAFATHVFSRVPDQETSCEAGIVNLLDRRVSGQEKGMLPYLLSKKMLAEYTRIAALELGPRIAVNAVAPGPVLPPPGRGDDYLHDHAGAMVLGSRPQSQDVAEAVLFLLESRAITGQIIFVDSGQHLL